MITGRLKNPLKRVLFQCMARSFLMLAILKEAYELDNGPYIPSPRRRRARSSHYHIETPFKNEDFMRIYRLPEESVELLEEDLCSYIPVGIRRSGLPIRTKILCTLSFLASGGYQKIISTHIKYEISQPSMSRALHQVTDALCHPDIVKKYIKCPRNSAERQVIQDKFHEKFGIPNVIGCIGSTLVSMLRPKTDEDEYICDKNQYALNVQLISDADLNIIQVNSSFGAALNDTSIFDQSSIKEHLENLHKIGETAYLLGNSEYPQRPYLMTPIQNPQSGTSDEHYNKLHAAAHNTVGQLIRNLKARFRCLLVDKPLHYHPDMVSKIVIACCVLHNICNEAGLGAPSLSADDLEDEWNFIPPTEDREEQGYCASRNALMNILSWSES